MSQHVLLDVGGTGIKGGVAEDGGRCVGTREFPARAGETREALIAHFCDIVETLWAQAAPQAAPGTIAMAFPGPFDYARGVPQMRGLGKYDALYGASLPDEMARVWRIRGGEWAAYAENIRYVFINDVSAFALGAMARGGLQGRVMCVCLGTGAGSAFCVDGVPCMDEAQGIPPNGWIYPLPCGDTTIEEALSARAIQRLAQRYCGTAYTPLELSQRADSEEAAAAWQVYGKTLCGALASLLHRFQADALVLGGKIARSFPLFGGPLQAQCGKEGVRLYVERETSPVVLEGLMDWIRRGNERT